MHIMDLAFPIVLVLSSMISAIMLNLTDAASEMPNIFNVLSYGAVGNAITDDTLAFIRTWNETCNAKTENSTMVIPAAKTFLVLPTTFAGPCSSSNISVMIQGKILAPKGPTAWKQHDLSRWLTFQGINGLVIEGPGVLDGGGNDWWNLSCRDHPGLKDCVTLAPTALSFVDCHQVDMSYVNVFNSPQTHILVMNSDNVHFKFLNIDSPGTSPNTDGIHIQRSSFINIRSSIIKSGDDCISIGDSTSNINISYINCGPGHGISIGSLGKDGSEAQVENILVSNVNFTNTTNGARIKTWQAGRGQARQITFQNLNFTNVENPIIIDQHYCDKKCKILVNSGVQVSDVSYYNAIGTSRTQVAVNFNCNQEVACTNITLNNIQLAPVVKGKQLISRCNNAHGLATGIVQPKSCLVQ